MQFFFLDSAESILELIDWHNANSPFVVLDFETTGKDARTCKLVEIQMSGQDPDEAVMFDAQYLHLLSQLKVRHVWQNGIRYDWKVAALAGTDLSDSLVHDLLLLDHLADENRDHDLDSRVQAEWGDDYKAQFWGKYENYQDAPFEERLDYGCRDIVYTGRLYRAVLAELEAQGIPESLVDHVHRLARALYKTELRGIRVDLDYCMSMGGELKLDIVETEAELRRLGGLHCDILEYKAWAKAIDEFKTAKRRAIVPKPDFNFASPSQVATLLYDRLGLPVQYKKKKRTTEAKALEKLAPLHPIAERLSHHSKITTMYGTFVEGVLTRAKGDRIYPGFNVNGTVTGRISHSDPNMGNIPSKDKWSKIRGIFVPDPGHKLITADYGQLEVCIAAHYSRDKNLLRIILEGASQHDITAEGLGVPRATAKTINFAMQYGATAFKIKEILACSQADAELALNKYWETYSGLKAFIDTCHAKMDRGESIANPFGRKRRFPSKFSTPWERASAQRQVFSSLIQGTGGDMMSMAFYRTSEELEARGWGQAWFTVHDEGLIQAWEQYLAEAEECLVRHMLAIGPEIGLTVPLKVESSGPLDRWQK